MRFLALLLLAGAACTLPQHGRHCGAITDASLEDLDTVKEPKFVEIAQRGLTPHEQVHLVDAIFDMIFPGSKIEPLKALIVNPAFATEAKDRILQRVADEDEALRMWVRAAVDDAKTSTGWWGIHVQKAELGLKVSRVAPASPADRGGVKEGDIVVALGERAITDALTFEEAGRTLDQKGATEAVIDVIRGQERFKILLRK